MARINLTHHRKFRRLARALGSPALALGTLELLWLAAYEAADPYVGAAADIGDAVQWPGDPAPLVAVLLECGLVDALGPDAYGVHDLWDHAPKYVRLRWSREHPGGTPPWQKSTSCVPETRTYPSRPAPSEERHAPTRVDPPNVRVLGRLCYELAPGLEDEGEKKDALKDLAVQYHLPYDATSITQALEAVRRAQLWARDALRSSYDKTADRAGPRAAESRRRRV